MTNEPGMSPLTEDVRRIWDAEALLPDDMVVVDRARFDWLLKIARKLNDLDGPGSYDHFMGEIRQLLHEFDKRGEGWLDPLP